MHLRSHFAGVQKLRRCYASATRYKTARDQKEIFCPPKIVSCLQRRLVLPRLFFHAKDFHEGYNILFNCHKRLVVFQLSWVVLD